MGKTRPNRKPRPTKTKSAPRSAGVRFDDQGPRLRAAELSLMEQRLCDDVLPEDFRSFLAKHNGGTPQPANFQWRHPKKGQRLGRGTRLLGLDSRPMGDPDRGMDCFSMALAIRDDLPRYCVPIGMVDGEELYDILLLFTQGKREGQVWIKDWSEVSVLTNRPSDPEAAVYFVARSFKAFLALLHDVADDELE